MLVLSNVFMTFAWYGNLKLRDMNGGKDPFPLFVIILLSWGIQECISLVVFTVLALALFKTETFRWNYIVSFVLILLAVYFAFKK